ncbi:hypothetical protein V1514DRAFT_111948 [Lipomyces japonicus]|uniref:uncharacterized protein n=1 Tax=Lipomyces japonicus TaxID=56871 RepID=UPI0034CEACFA
MSSQSPVKIGLIGTGIFASQRHYPAIESQPDILKLTAVANRSADKAQAFAKKTGVPENKIYSDLDSLLADPEVDAIDALLPSQFTLDAVKKAVAAGKPIAIEKPIAARLDQAKQIVAIAKSTDLPVAVLENFLFWNSIAEIKAVLPKIGKLVYFSHYSTAPFNGDSIYLGTWWRQKPEHVGGFLSDGGVHQVALFTEVLGQVESLSALTTQVKEQSGDVDTLTSTLKLQNGAFGTFTYTSAVSYPRINKLTIHGEEGTIIYDFADKQNTTITLYNSENKQGKVIPNVQVVNEAVPEEFADFAHAVQNKDKSLLKATPEKAFHHFAVIVAAVESAQNGGTAVAVATP